MIEVFIRLCKCVITCAFSMVFERKRGLGEVSKKVEILKIEGCDAAFW